MLFLRTASTPVHNETVKPLEGGDKTLDFEESRSSSTCEGTRGAQGARETGMVHWHTSETERKASMPLLKKWQQQQGPQQGSQVVNKRMR